ncbi:hypothetical protein [Aquabacterium sp.]|uniref:hypothetical protein n=1 Tax=Aquabacterium sp. TaxID=1872578 RepID=UPI004037D247
MAFMNEWVSEEDIKKYNLPGVWMKVKGRTPLQYAWTIDRDRSVFLIDYASGREEFSNHIDFVLCWDGEIHKARLISDPDHGGLENVITTWYLIGIDSPSDSHHNRDEVMSMLKEALRGYKLSGVVTPIQNHTAVFDF